MLFLQDIHLTAQLRKQVAAIHAREIYVPILIFLFLKYLAPPD